MASSKFVWLSFDLGVQGDYESLYKWLDGHNAKECGDSVACFSYTYEGNIEKAFITDISEKVELTQKSRLYLIREVDGTYKGRFVYGNRKNAPWKGAAGFTQISDDSGE